MSLTTARVVFLSNTYWIADEMGQEVADQMNETLSERDGGADSQVADPFAGYSSATDSSATDQSVEAID